MKLDPELHDKIVNSCTGHQETVGERILWLHERLAAVEQALLRAHDDAVSKQPCPCGDNAEVQHLLPALKPSLSHEDKLELANIDYLRSQSTMAELKADEASDAYNSRKAKEQTYTSRGVEPPPRPSKK